MRKRNKRNWFKVEKYYLSSAKKESHSSNGSKNNTFSAGNLQNVERNHQKDYTVGGRASAAKASISRCLSSY